MTGRSSVPDQNLWAAWHPAELARRLGIVSRPWCVVGGWALDLWHGAVTRPHEDLEFTVLREDLGAFRQALGDLAFYAVHEGQLAPLAADWEPAPEIEQIWCFDHAAGCWRADMMIEPGKPDLWVCKRAAALARPRSDMVARTADGIPYLNPAAVLLFKAKYRRPKDEVDFAGAAPKLPPGERHWLKLALAHVHPGHDWIAAL